MARFRLLCLLIPVLLGAGCGQAGDLYLPEPAQPVSTPPAVVPTDEADQQGTDDEGKNEASRGDAGPLSR